MVIDRKFRILAVNPCKAGKVYTEAEGLFLCAHDLAVVPALLAYADSCKELGCSDEHLESIELLIGRVREYQKEYSKVPDTDETCEIDRCLGGIGVE